jgi:DNA-binding transcriptional MocR family regulator
VNTAEATTRTGEIMRIIRQRIERRALTPGARLPSVRAMAESSGISKSTIVEAYERLVAEGTIRARAGSGFYVAAPLAPLALAEIGPPLDPHIDPLWMLRQSLNAPAGALMPGCGWLPDHWMAENTIRKGLRLLARSGAKTGLAAYGPPSGSEPLRRLLVRRLLDQNVETAPDQILITDSGTHAIDLVLRFLIEPGDVVLIDNPCYFNFQALLRAHRAKAVGVPMTPHGPDVAAFERALLEHRPRLYITNSASHNPTGATLAASTAHRLLNLAEAHDLVIVEDDIMADFEDTPAPRLAAFDGLDRVLRIGSFSKSLSGAVRLGYIAARRDWMAGITDLRIATGLSGCVLSAELVYASLLDGSYRRHMERTRRRLAQARQHALDRLRSLGIVPWLEPISGIFLWCKLPKDIDAAEVARGGLSDNIIFAPGNVFSPDQTFRSYLRFNVAMMDDDRIFAHLKRACA